MREDLKAIRGLKGIAALEIACIWHYVHLTGSDTIMPFGRVFTMSYAYGQYAVELFFLLSGFGMMMGYSKGILSRDLDFPKYFFRRVSKFYPLLILTTFLLVVLQGIYYVMNGSFFQYSQYSIRDVLIHLYCLSGNVMAWSLNQPAWYLSVSLICYVIMYAVLYHSKSRRVSFYWFAGLFLLGFMGRVYEVDCMLVTSNVLRGFAPYFYGCLLYYVYEKRDILNTRRIGWIAFLFCVAAYLIERFSPESVDLTGGAWYVMVLGFGPAILLSALFLPWVAKVLSIRPLQWLGTISFAMYLWHIPVQLCFKLVESLGGFQFNYATKSLQIIYTVCVVAVSAFYHYVVRKPYEDFAVGFFKAKTPAEDKGARS